MYRGIGHEAKLAKFLAVKPRSTRRNGNKTIIRTTRVVELVNISDSARMSHAGDTCEVSSPVVNSRA